jgi:DNA-binding Xre family transcriptional regulator
MKTISYLPLEFELKKQRMTKTSLRKMTKLSSATISKISKNEEMSMNAIKKIAEVLDCDISNIIKFEEQEQKKGMI